MNAKLLFLVFGLGLATNAIAQTTAPARYISPLDCDYRGRIGALNIVESGDVKFKVSQKGHDEYNQFSISKRTKISGVNVYVTFLTADYSENKFVLSDRFEVEKNKWYRMYFQYNPVVRAGRILAKLAQHREGLATHEMTTMLDLQGATLYQEKSDRRILPTFGNYHWGGCPHKVESHFTEILVSKEPVEQHLLLGAKGR